MNMLMFSVVFVVQGLTQYAVVEAGQQAIISKATQCVMEALPSDILKR